MANYYGQARTNYFAVKDGKAFEEEMANLPVEVITQTTKDGRTLYGFLDGNQDGAGLETLIWDEDTDEERELDWTEILARHLADNEVAIVMEVGHEKYRYLSGYAFAVNNKGEVRDINLDSITELARELGDNITSVSY